MNDNPYQPPHTTSKLPAGIPSHSSGNRRWLLTAAAIGFVVAYVGRSLRYELNGYWEEEFVVLAAMLIVMFLLLRHAFRQPLVRATGFFALASLSLWLAATVGWCLVDADYVIISMTIVCWGVSLMIGGIVLAIPHRRNE